jgi:hypothetical protein
MQLRLIRDWKGYKAGKVFEPGDGVAEILIRRKIAEPVGQVADQAEKPERPRRRRQ